MYRLRGREIDGKRIAVVVAKDRRKTPDEMRDRDDKPLNDRNNERRSGSAGRDDHDRDHDRRERDEDGNRHQDDRDHHSTNGEEDRENHDD